MIKYRNLLLWEFDYILSRINKIKFIWCNVLVKLQNISDKEKILIIVRENAYCV